MVVADDVRVVLSGHGRLASRSGEMAAKKDDLYDVYVLSQSWLPHFCCYQKPDSCPAFIDKNAAWAGNHLVLHGLWPSRSSGEWPSFCKSEHNKLSPQKISDQISPLAATISPSLKQSPEFAMHEWKAHGSCSGLDPAIYFSESLRAHIGVPGKGMDRGTPKILVDNPGGKVKTHDVRSSYKKKIGLKCTKGCVLSEVITCFCRREDNKAGEQIDCPAPILSRGDSCGKCKDILLTMLGRCELPEKRSAAKAEEATQPL